jgi:hypothetical protein
VRKNFNPSRGPGLPEKSGHSPYLLKEHREGKKEKKSSSPGKVQAGRAFPITALYLFKEHREGEKGEKILVPVHFSWREDSRD